MRVQGDLSTSRPPLALTAERANDEEQRSKNYYCHQSQPGDYRAVDVNEDVLRFDGLMYNHRARGKDAVHLKPLVK